MFHYSQYRSTDAALIQRFVDAHPLAIVTSVRDGAWQCSHVPLFLDAERHELFGHVDARNRQFDAGAPFEAQVVFAGLDAYIPPEGYATRQLPTWNYLAVHATGTVSASDDVSHNLDILRRTALRLAGTPSAFRVDDGDPRVRQWIGGIRGLRVALGSLEGRFKLSQDKQPQDVLSAARHFSRVVAERATPQRLLEFAALPVAEETLP